jgi:hypothetical protein
MVILAVPNAPRVLSLSCAMNLISMNPKLTYEDLGEKNSTEPRLRSEPNPTWALPRAWVGPEKFQSPSPPQPSPTPGIQAQPNPDNMSQKLCLACKVLNQLVALK